MDLKSVAIAEEDRIGRFPGFWVVECGRQQPVASRLESPGYFDRLQTSTINEEMTEFELVIAEIIGRFIEDRAIEHRAVHAAAPTIFSASRMRISPDISLGRSRSRVLARVQFSCLFASIRSIRCAVTEENAVSTWNGGISNSVPATVSGRTAGKAPPSARCESRSIFSRDVAARYTTSLHSALLGRSTANPVLPVRPLIP